jgi:hypothetical protein
MTNVAIKSSKAINDKQPLSVARKLIKKNSNDSAALLSKYNNRANKFGKRNSFIYSVSQVIQQFQNEVPVGVPASKFRRNYTAYQLSRTDEETDGEPKLILQCAPNSFFQCGFGPSTASIKKSKFCLNKEKQKKN